MSVDKTAEAILSLPDKGKFTHREMIWQADWTDTDIATYAELKQMAKLWLMRKEILQLLHLPAHILNETCMANHCIICDQYTKQREQIEALESGNMEMPEYEYFFESKPCDVIQIDGWHAIATDRLTADPEILIAKGKLRRIGG